MFAICQTSRESSSVNVEGYGQGLCHFINDTNFGRFKNRFALITTSPSDATQSNLLSHGTSLI